MSGYWGPARQWQRGPGGPSRGSPPANSWRTCIAAWRWYSPDWTSYSVPDCRSWTRDRSLAGEWSTRGLSTSCRPGAGSSAPSALRAPLHKTFKLIKTTDRSITTCVVGEEHAVRVVLAGGLTVARLAQVLDMFYQRSFLVLAQPARPELGAAIPGFQTVIALVCSTIHSIYYIEMDKLHKRG